MIRKHSSRPINLRSLTLALVTSVAMLGLSWASAAEPPAPASTIVRYDGHKVVRAQIRSAQDIVVMESISTDLWSHGVGIGPVDWRVAPDKLAALDQSGIPYTILIDNVQTLIDAENARHRVDGTFFDDYRTYDQVNTYLNQLAALRPDIATIVNVGQSLQNRTVWGIRIAGTGGTGSQPAVLYDGCQHAREWITPMSTMFIADYLVRNYTIDPDVTALLDDVAVYVVPISNPDGYVYSWTSDRLWRKNRRQNSGGSFGVDLNRNWGYQWGGEGSSGTQTSEVYRGTGPFSEPETQVLRDYITTHTDIVGTIDIHSYSQLVLQPWGYTAQLPPDHPTFDTIGARMEAAMEALYGLNYIHGPTYTTIYPAAGIALDWSYGALGLLGISFELRDTGQFGFILPADQIVPASEECLAGALVLADWIRILLVISFPDGLPATLIPDTPTDIRLDISPVNGGVYQSGSGKVYSRIGHSGAFNPANLTPLGGTLFRATLPGAPCGDDVEYYFEAATTAGDIVRSPADAPLSVHEATAVEVETIFSDNFQSDLGWTVANNGVTAGAWVRGVPNGGGTRGDPPTDYDGSGSCYITGNGPNNDLDGGPTQLTSPRIDLSAGDALISFAAWFYNDDNDIDRMLIEISGNDGANWELVESMTNTGGWTTREFLASIYITPTANVRLRFSATDNPNDSVTEAALDAFKVQRITCGGSGLTLTVDATCPAGGPISISWTGATNGGQVGLLYSNNTGNFILPPGPCAGTQTGLSGSGLQLVFQGGSGAGGSRTINGTAPPAACGHFMQLVDGTSCDTSNVVTVN